MSSYKRAIARLSILSLMIAGGVLLSSKPVAAVSCLQQCSINESNCLKSCGRNLTCEDLCKEAFTACAKRCT
jgi:hypothetical protein